MTRLHPVSLALVALCVAVPIARADDGPAAELSPVSAERRAWAEDLARSLGLELRSIHAVKQAPWVASADVAARPGWTGLKLELNGLTIECRRCEDPSEADDLFGRHIQPDASARTVVELRGDAVVVLRGRVLDDPRVAARALELSWPRNRAEDPRAIAALAANDPASLGPFAGYCFQPGGSLYEAGAGVLRAARANEDELEEREASGISWRFLDAVKNHVLVTLPGDLVVEALVTPSTMLYSQGTGEAEQRREEDYLMALLGAAKVTPPPPSKGLVELLDAQSGR